MDVWVCNGCHAEIPQKDKPEVCPLCGQHSRDFDPGKRKDLPAVDKESSKKYEEALKQLESYDEGCEPEKMKYCCEG